MSRKNFVTAEKYCNFIKELVEFFTKLTSLIENCITFVKSILLVVIMENKLLFLQEWRLPLTNNIYESQAIFYKGWVAFHFLWVSVLWPMMIEWKTSHSFVKIQTSSSKQWNKIKVFFYFAIPIPVFKRNRFSSKTIVS